MAPSRHLATLLVAVLVLSCVICAYCDINGTILLQAFLQASPGVGTMTILTTLKPPHVVDVICRTSNSSVNGDSWWLYANYVPPNNTSLTGWVADFNVYCGSTGLCDVPQCI